ncbi:TetR/AcrR family transcriptional regulator [Chitinophaga alhagiae]|uniref:TetR/AcrR family transcriptional regulator n=1 Tax=Chitinophaga alhagiae TaxID=2203219 RepID=UPI000E5A678F|nr:TetR/AcrR family transcriptional regulator [Chitinophaga alhagiae]
MNAENNTNTEEKILSAAENVFHEKGYDGARMQEIADKAGINKGLLHYYFKTKDALFDAIFSMALKRMVANIHSILAMELSLEEKMDLVVDGYMNILLKNSALPRFVINELNKDADRFIARHIHGSASSIFTSFDASVNKEIAAGNIRPINSRHLFMNMVSMTIFPFIGRPMIQVIIGLDNKEFQLLMHERREAIKSFIKMSLRR